MTPDDHLPAWKLLGKGRITEDHPPSIDYGALVWCGVWFALRWAVTAPVRWYRRRAG